MKGFGGNKGFIQYPKGFQSGNGLLTGVKGLQLGTLLNYPSVLKDGNTVAWYDFMKRNKTDTDSDYLVSRVFDLSGNDNHLVQNTNENKPTITRNGLLSVEKFIKTVPFTYNQPEMVYMLVKQLRWNAVAAIFDGNANDSMTVAMSNSTPKLTAYAGSAIGLNSNLPVNKWGILRVLFNGASSFFKINETTPLTGNTGSANAGAITLAGRGATGLNRSEIFVREAIFRKIIDSTDDEQAIYDYLNNKLQKINGVNKLLTIGDSITYQLKYQYHLNLDNIIWEKAETTTGVSGHKAMAVISSRIVPMINNNFVGQQLGNSIYERVDDAQYYSPDVIILMGGQNDIEGLYIEIGTPEDEAYTGIAVSENPPSFYSAYKGTLKKLIEQNEGVSIICCTPFFGTDATVSQKQEIATAIINCAIEYGCEYRDLLNNSGINESNYNTYLSDGVHLSTQGGILIASKIN